ncbi:MAG: flagellar motor switch protein FliG [Cellulomonas sp.]|uniref:Flagellar motor switch protein FliG n=1 Tax=Cellulomonas gelida TaxID=1712 RepID=A0A4Y3KPH5_9CELL|nr:MULTISPECIES: flagellar motor switch protein FliG [Cellulomonas]KMM46915.1 flagellar motor switch protein FliG [Cellulomonas sp. A375-1]MCR6649604.1 flagellar motor switch protein FliG [Cellulomonas sp.]MCR6705575.1 flagellar motor switch protein FliG [Cellulomonas sp.]GEA85294.1 flagellar motor switch protein FliG [Cellulomonas gelida]GGL16892.1 flagellar motor switch protein FliG [Cellulomonas gelida]
MSVQLSGPQKAAMVLVQLGRERASRVMASMEASEIEELSAQILRLDRVDQDLADAVLEEFYDASVAGPGLNGGMALAQQLLEASLGVEAAAAVMERLQVHLAGQPFEFLQQADARQVISLLSAEHPQAIALVLAHLRPDHASAILAGLEPTLQGEVAHRIALMERASPDVVQVVAEQLQRKASAVLTPRELAAVGGVQPLVEIINRADPTTEKAILEGLAERDEELAEEVRGRMFVFNDVVLLEDRAMQMVLRQVENSDLSLALKGVSDEVRDTVLRNLSERARENLVEEIELLGPVRLSQVEEARSTIVQSIRRLEESGQIVIRRDGEDEYVA